MQRLLAVATLSLLCCASVLAHQDHKASTLREVDGETTEQAAAEQYAGVGSLLPLTAMFNQPMLCCINDVRVRSHMEGILAASLDAYTNGKLSQAVKLLRLVVQRGENLGCAGEPVSPCMSNVLDQITLIIRAISSANVIQGKEMMLRSGDELKSEGLIQPACIAYSRAFESKTLSLTLNVEQFTFVRPVHFVEAFSLAGVVPQIIRPQGDRPESGGHADFDEPDQDDKQGDATFGNGTAVTAGSSEDAFEADCELVATTFGWTLLQTKERMRNQTLFAVLVKEYMDLYPGEFAGSAMARRPGEYATVWFKGTEPPGARQMADDFYDDNGMKVLLISGMQFSFVEQEERMMQIAEQLQGAGFSGIGSAFIPGDIIEVSLPSDNMYPPTSPSSVPPGPTVDPLASSLLGGINPYGVKLIFTDQTIDMDHHARGGREMYTATESDGTYSVCTSGFTVSRESDGVDGLTTAAHCTGMRNFDAESPEGDFTLYHKGEHCETYGDVEWKSSDHSEPAEFWASASDKRSVMSVTTAFSANDVHCVYSRMQASRTCDYVYSTSVSQSGTLGYCSGRTSYNLVAFDNDLTVPGDSGGPWSYSTEAAGTVKGAKWLSWAWRSTMTRADRLPDALGVAVKLAS